MPTGAARREAGELELKLNSRKIARDSSWQKRENGAARQLLAPAALRPIGRQRTRPKPEPRTERRRHIVQRFPAVAAVFLGCGVHAQPMPASLALRIDALHGPPWQIAHSALLTLDRMRVVRILRLRHCSVKIKATIYRGLVSDLWKSDA